MSKHTFHHKFFGLTAMLLISLRHLPKPLAQIGVAHATLDHRRYFFVQTRQVRGFLRKSKYACVSF